MMHQLEHSTTLLYRSTLRDQSEYCLEHLKILSKFNITNITIKETMTAMVRGHTHISSFEYKATCILCSLWPVLDITQDTTLLTQRQRNKNL